MRNVGRKLAFILAASNHGTMIVNRFDYRMVGPDSGIGVGHQILDTAAFDPAEVELAVQLLELRKQHHGDGVVAIDCGANIGVHTIEWAIAMTGWGSGDCGRGAGTHLLCAGGKYRDQQLLQCHCHACRGLFRNRRDENSKSGLSHRLKFRQS